MSKSSTAAREAAPKFNPHAAAFGPEGASAYLDGIVSPSALKLRRHRGQGPPYRKDECGRIIYVRADLDAWLESLERG